MAVVLGTSSGFVTATPTGDPAGTGVTIDGFAAVTKDTSPSTAVKITEIGWYRASGTNAANWELGLYADSGGVAGALLFVDATNSSTSNGWLSVAVDWAISGSTAYWLGLQMDAHSGSSSVDSAASGGAGIDIAAGTALPDPFGGGAVSDADGMYAIYALWAPASTDHTRTPADTLSLADARALATGKGLADTLALTDARALARGSALADALSLSDAQALGRGSGLADSLALTDALGLGPGKGLADVLTLADEATPEISSGTSHSRQVDDPLALFDLADPRLEHVAREIVLRL